MVFDLDVGGHHGSYFEHLLRHVGGLPAIRMTLLVSPRLATMYPHVVALAEPIAGVQLVAVKGAEEEAISAAGGMPGALGTLRRARAEWRVLCRYASEMQADHVISLYLDRFLMGPLALGMRAPCPVSGIYFRPSFHYGQYSGGQLTVADRLRGVRQRATLWRAVRHPDLAAILTLDDTAVAPIRQLGGTALTRHLADPVAPIAPSPEAVEDCRAKLEIPSGAQVLLLFGALTARKGVYQVLEALERLPGEVAARTCLLLAGRPPAGASDKMTAAVTRCSARSAATIISRLGYISEADADCYFALSDVVLATYQRHLGSSGILIRAAAAGRPAISSDWGLMGEQTRRHRLGLDVDATSAEQIADAIVLFASAEPGSLSDRSAMKAFASANSPANFATALLDEVL